MLVNLNDVLKDAQSRGYGVGLFNTTDTYMLQAAIDAAEKKRSPIIIGTAEVLLPYGELEIIAPSVINAAKKASVPVVVHFDHGLTFDRCMQALKLGFSSVMYDGSVHPYDENVKNTREIVKIAHSFGATVEGEIGHVGEAASSENTDGDLYTTVSEAKEYLCDTGVDALAVAIGTAHGAYRKKPRLDFDRLREIRSAVDVPLVLHGGSGLSDEDFRTAVKDGISKINIFTDMCIAGDTAMKDGTEAGLGYLETGKLKVEKIRGVIERKIELFGSAGKA